MCLLHGGLGDGWLALGSGGWVGRAARSSRRTRMKTRAMTKAASAIPEAVRNPRGNPAR